MKNTLLHFDNFFLNNPIQYDQIKLYQAGDCITKADFFIPTHKQICDEISYIVSGEIIFHLDGKKYKLKAGDLFFCPKNSRHTLQTVNENPARYVYLGYEFIKSNPFYEKWKKINHYMKSLPSPIFERAFSLEPLFNDLLFGFQQGEEGNELFIELCCMHIILDTYKFFKDGDVSALVYKADAPKKDALVHKIITFIDLNILKIKKLTDISKYMGFSYSYVSQLFKEQMGITLNDYYQRKRLGEAMRLFEKGISITEASEILGYDSVQSFSRAFKNKSKLSPQEYIKTIGK